MNVFWHELRTYRKVTLTWALALSAGVIMFLSLYPTFTNDIEASKSIIASFPPAFRDALGISLQNFFTIFGFYSYLFTFITMAGAIQAMNNGVGIVSKEDTNKTADFLLSKPITRKTILTSKILAALASLIVTNLIFDSVALVAAKIVSRDSFSTKIFILISLTLLLVQLVFLALGILFAVTIPKIKSVISVSLPTVFAFFIIGMVGSALGNLDVRYVTPFKFYDPAYIIEHSGYEPKYLLLELIVIVVVITVSYVIYLKKDIKAAT